DGDEFWLADPGLLLEHVELPPVPEPTPPDAEEPESGEGGKPGEGGSPSARDPEPGAIPTLTPEHVEPLGPAEVAPSRPEPPPAPPVAEDRQPPAPPVERGPSAAGSARVTQALRHALVAEDSFIARVFLTRMLEQRGFAVLPAADAAELFEALP